MPSVGAGLTAGPEIPNRLRLPDEAAEALDLRDAPEPLLPMLSVLHLEPLLPTDMRPPSIESVLLRLLPSTATTGCCSWISDIPSDDGGSSTGDARSSSESRSGDVGLCRARGERAAAGG